MWHWVGENMPKATSNTHLGTPVSLPFPWKPPFKFCILWSPQFSNLILLKLASILMYTIPQNLIYINVAIALCRNLHFEECERKITWFVFVECNMGLSSHPSLVSSLTLKDFLEGSTEEHKISSSYGCLWSKVLASQAKKKKKKGSRRPRRVIIMKRRGGGSRRGSNGIQRRVRTLKRLVPNSDESMGLDGLFRETANYILSLQTRVRVMQVMVNVLTGSNDDE